MPEGSHPALHQDPMGEESSQLFSSLSASHQNLSPDCYRQLCVEPLDREGERPVSLVSTLSSGSSRDSHSLYESNIALCSSTTPPIPSEDDIDLELSPTQSAVEKPGEQSPPIADSRGRWQERLKHRVINNQRNNTNRKSSGEIRHVLTASPVVTDAMAPNPKLTYVDRVVMEIIETERMYVKDLRSIVEDYLVHIIDMSNLPIQPEQVCALFGNIEDIYVFNSELLQSLDMCDNDPVAIAQCFVDKSEYFEIYTQYCTNYPNSVAALTDCMRSKTLAKFFRERQAALKRSLPLGSYLLKPVQRILKYHLLLQEIAKHFDPEEEGYEVVQEAIDTMTGVAWYINDMKRKHEHAVRVQEIQSLLINWKGPDLTTYGELVLEGTFPVLRAKNTRTLFLFEKMLLITKKRGEHYVYKIDILCSTLMLLDSAKDPLLFSVIHFKHPKQPHTVQAKSVEEKRLWAHHIKRLILENHSTIIPQKAKDVLSANLNYPGKNHYSPERVKKAESCQVADFHRGARNERRRSEPAKQIVGSAKAVLKHADSDGALLGDRCCVRPAAGVSTTASALGEPRAERPRLDDSPEPLRPADGDLKLGSPRGEGGLKLDNAEEQEEEENYKDVVLMEDDQDDLKDDTTELKTTPTEEPNTCRQEETCVDEAVKKTLATQVPVEEMCPLGSGPQARRSDELVELCPESPKCPVSPDQQQAESLELHTASKETREEEELGSDSSSLQVEETSVLTNGELSEEEEDLVHNKSILPSSVLDQASVIAERFISTLSRPNSLISEDLVSPTCPSPSTDNDLLKSTSSAVDLEQPSQMSASSNPEPYTTLENISSPLAFEAPMDTLIEQEPRSTLSKQDRLLIDKIRTYYEHAEHQDANFSIKRRESLSYIPSGLVRQLSRQLNSIPQVQSVSAHRKSLSRNRPTSWSVFDLPGLEKTKNSESHQKTEPQIPVEAQARSRSIADGWPTEQVFRSSSEMLKVWQDMETEEEEEENQVTQQREKQKCNEVVFDTSDGKTTKHLPSNLEGSEIPSPATTSAAMEGRSDQECQPNDEPLSQERNSFSHSQLPKIISFRTSLDEDQILQDMGKMKNKVFQLARQYSQRIKNNRPAVWQRSREMAQGFRNMPALPEEKMQLRKKGKPNLRLPLNSCHQVAISEVCSPSPVQTPSSDSSSQTTVACPQSPQPETFHWPDVQELRSKYTEPARPKVTRSRTVPNGMLERSRNIFNGCSLKYSSSIDLHKALSDSTRTLSERMFKGRSPSVEDWPQPTSQAKLQPLLCRWSSLDHMLGSLPLNEVQNLQEPRKNSYTAGRQDGDSPHHEGLDATVKTVLSSGKVSESKLVKSLRDKFQSLSSGS